MKSGKIRSLFKPKNNPPVVMSQIGNAEHVIKVNTISKEVAIRLNHWMNTPYKETVTEKQDIELFASRITDYIITRMKE